MARDLDGDGIPDWMERRADRNSVSDVDARPGGARTSAAYADAYDPQFEMETTNLPENRLQLEWQRREQRKSAAEMLRETAEERIYEWPDAGRFVIPRDNSFASHWNLITSGDQLDLRFDPATYQHFDAILAAQANRPDIFDPSHADYAKYATLRNNLAVLRNDIMGLYMDDGSFDPGDQKFLPMLEQIASEIGTAIRHDNSPVLRYLAPRLNAELLNLEGDGAAYAYNFLLKRQESAGVLGQVVDDVKRLLGLPRRMWNLPPIDYTPFAEEALEAPATPDILCMNDRDAMQYCQQLYAKHATAPRVPVEDMSAGDLRASVDYGILILRALENLKFADKSLQEVIDSGTPQDRQQLKGFIGDAVDYFQDTLDRLHITPEMAAGNPKLAEAQRAADALQHGIELLAKLEKPVSLSQTMQISADITQQPEHWNELSGQTVDRLMQTLKGGLEEAVHTLDQQQMDVEAQQEEASEQAVETALMQSDLGKRRRRRRQVSSQVKAKQARKVDLALRADDRAAGQGIHAQQRQQEQPRQTAPRMNPEAMEAVKDIGRVLSENSRNAAGLQAQQQEQQAALAAQQVRDGDKIAPDDVPFAARTQKDPKGPTNTMKW